MEPPPPSYDAVVTGNYNGQQYNQGLPPMQMELNGPAYNPAYDPSAYPHQPATTSDVQIDLPPYPISNQSLLISLAPPAYSEFSGVSPEHTASTGIIPSTETLPVERASTNQTEMADNSDGSGYCAVFCAFSMFSAIPIVMVIIGFANRDHCSMEDRVPKFMMLSGGLATLLSIFFVGSVSKKKSTLGSLFKFLFVLGVIGLLAVQIWGSYYVFRKWSAWNSFYKYQYRGDGCDKTTYLFSFSMLIIFWTLGPCLVCSAKISK